MSIRTSRNLSVPITLSPHDLEDVLDAQRVLNNAGFENTEAGAKIKELVQALRDVSNLKRDLNQVFDAIYLIQENLGTSSNLANVIYYNFSRHIGKKGQ